jgi:hypothetical protein
MSAGLPANSLFALRSTYVVHVAVLVPLVGLVLTDLPHAVNDVLVRLLLANRHGDGGEEAAVRELGQGRDLVGPVVEAARDVDLEEQKVSMREDMMKAEIYDHERRRGSSVSNLFVQRYRDRRGTGQGHPIISEPSAFHGWI